MTRVETVVVAGEGFELLVQAAALATIGRTGWLTCP